MVNRWVARSTSAATRGTLALPRTTETTMTGIVTPTSSPLPNTTAQTRQHWPIGGQCQRWNIQPATTNLSTRPRKHGPDAG
jgi:hypothetical protein